MAMLGVTKPHVVCIPFPLQGHINPMLKIAKLLHHKGFHVTFVNTEFNHKWILNARGPDALRGLPDFCFHTLPLEHPPSNSHVSASFNLLALRQACRNNLLSLLRQLIATLNDTKSKSKPLVPNNPPVTCMVSDAMLTCTQLLSEELEIPNVFVWHMAATGVVSFIHFRHQMKQLVTLLKEPSKVSCDHEILDSKLEWIPGRKGARLRDLLKVIQIKDQNGYMEDSCEADMERLSKASAIIFNTFDDLEAKDLNSLSSIFPQVFSIGPTQLLLNHISNDFYDTINGNLWDVEHECIEWLDSKESNSVIYVSFGSLTITTAEQLTELAWGLADSNHSFLWIIRPDLMKEDESAIDLAEKFLLETKGRGFVASWCSQEQVLNHPSIGGFLTHCGWNSMIESISAGVPMICWPFFGDQFANSRKSCNEWGIGLELSGEFKRDQVEKLVNEILRGEKGKKVKGRVMEWKKRAQEATNIFYGSSSFNLNNLVNQVLLQSNSQLRGKFVSE